MTNGRGDDGTSREARVVVDHYAAAYGKFTSRLYAQIRQEAFGEDFGQQSWQLAEEQDRLIRWLDLSPGRRLLDVACGSGGPTLRIAARTGCDVHGIDVEANGIAAADEMAQARGLAERATFSVMNASEPLSFPPGSFDAIVCIDAISHFRDRLAVLADWARLLKPGGYAVFTDPLIVTGPISSFEVAIRSFDTHQLFVPRGLNEGAIAAAGLELVTTEDRTENTALVAPRRLGARDRHPRNLRRSEEPRMSCGRRRCFASTACWRQSTDCRA